MLFYLLNVYKLTLRIAQCLFARRAIQIDTLQYITFTTQKVSQLREQGTESMKANRSRLVNGIINRGNNCKRCRS